MGSQNNREELLRWLTNKSEILNNKHWNNIMAAEQETVDAKKEIRSRRIQSIAIQARNDIKRFRTELGNLPSNEFGGFKGKGNLYLDNWDNFFYYMAKYGVSGNLDDFGAATRHYNAVSKDLHELNRLLGVDSDEVAVQPANEASVQVNNEVPVIREKEIIHEKIVIVKTRCKYCNGTYDESLDSCPNCGARK